MRLFGRKKSGRKGPMPVYDRFLGDAELRQAYERVLAGEVDFLDDFLDSRADDWLVMGIFLDDDSQISAEMLSQWVQHRPSGRSLGWLGMAQIRDAWAIRGRTVAADVDSNAWEAFYSGLRAAEETLRYGTEVGPGSADPWIGLMATARGLQMDSEEEERRFAEAHGRSAYRPDACDMFLQALCKKWGGTHERMFDFARWVVAKTPADSPTARLLPMAHFEYALAEASNGQAPSAYLSRPDVSTELCAAAERFVRATPDPARPVDLGPLNAFVLTLSPIDERSARLVEECVRRIADRPTSSPWSYYGDAIMERYQMISRERLATARRF